MYIFSGYCSTVSFICLCRIVKFINLTNGSCILMVIRIKYVEQFVGSIILLAFELFS